LEKIYIFGEKKSNFDFRKTQKHKFSQKKWTQKNPKTQVLPTLGGVGLIFFFFHFLGRYITY